MKNIVLVFTLALAGGNVALGQRDSSYCDPGLVSLSKKFTQTITIRGSDLEKMPFTHLSEVLGVWVYGAYSNRSTVSYVVDGLPVGDVNGYSIYDIDEIVLIQNAGALLNTGGLQQEIVLIRTKRGKGPKGINFAVQSGMVSDTGSSRGRVRWYHNFFASGYRNFKHVSIGLSANYQRDVWPLPGGTTVTPYNLQRWRLNGYFAWRPDAYNEIEAAVNFVPQRMESNGDSLFKGYSYHGWNKGSQNYWLPRLRWHGEWLRGLSNDLEGRYLGSTYRERDLSDAGDTIYNYRFKTMYFDTVHGEHVAVREALRYVLQAGGWRISPAFSLLYEHLSYRQGAERIDSSGPQGVYRSNGASAALLYGKGHWFTLVPAVDISYREVLDVQGGVERYCQPHPDAKAKRYYPFVTATVDVLKMVKPGSGGSVQVYGSYAKRRWTQENNNYGQQYESLADLRGGTAFFVPGALSAGNAIFSSFSNYFPNLYRPDLADYWVWEVGIGAVAAGGRWKFNYNFERRNIYKMVFIPLPAGTGVAYAVGYPNGPSALHHFSVETTAGSGARWEWRSRLQVTLLRSKLDPTSLRIYESDVAGDKDPDKLSWTGGWVNRVRVGRLEGGLDLLWHSGEWVTPNVFAGYWWGKAVEVFVEGRGMIRNTSSTLMDARRYYTVGGKFTL